MRLADLASILAQGCTLWTDSFKLSGTPARSGGFRFYNKKNAAPFDAAFLIRMKYYFITFEFVVTFASETHCVTAAS